MTDKFLVAVAQATPVFLNATETIAKACRLITEAGAQGARLVLFPEAFVPAYPEWVWVLPGGEQRKLNRLYSSLLENAISIPDENTAKLCQAAGKAKVHVAIGLNERNTAASHTSLYNTLLYIDDKGEILGWHRKLVPTADERTVWANGDGATLKAFPTSLGVLGGLICWENYMPLARYAMYAWGTQIYLAPTWDYGDQWIATLRHIAKEGGAYVLGCCMPLQVKDIPEELGMTEYYESPEQWINPGGSCIIQPNGKVIAGPLEKEEGILLAEVNLHKNYGIKRMLDVAGHYARPDVFRLTINRQAQPVLEDEENHGQINQSGS